MAIDESGEQNGVPGIHDVGIGTLSADLGPRPARHDPAGVKRHRPIRKRLQSCLMRKWIARRVRHLCSDDRRHM